MGKRILCLLLALWLLTAAPKAAAATTEVYTAAGISYPAIFGEPVLGEEAAKLVKEDIAVAAEQITNVGDAIYYIDTITSLNNPDDYCRLFSDLLKNDYDEVGIIYLPRVDRYNEPYLYIKQDGIYYPFDPMAIAWFDDYWLDGMQAYTDVNALAGEMVSISTQLWPERPLQGTYAIAPLYAPDICNAAGITYPSVFGEPVLGEEAKKLARANDAAAAAEQITNVGDAIYYMSGFTPFDQPIDACNFFAALLEDNYEEIGIIYLYRPGNGFFLSYIRHEGMYYVFMPIGFAKGENLWGNAPKSGTDLSELGEQLMITCPYTTGPDDHDPWTSYGFQPLYGTDFYNAKGIPYASALGEPILKEAAEELARAGGVAAAAEQITNVGDAIYFMTAFPAFDQPGDANSVFSDLLVGDYDEVGHITMMRQGNGYTLTYIQQDGIYYLFDPFRMPSGLNIWATAPSSGTDLDAIAEKLMVTFPYDPEGKPATMYMIELKYTTAVMEYYTVNGSAYIAQWGEPILKETAAELAKTGDITAAAEQVTNVGDAIYYLQSAENVILPRDACQLFARLLADDYDEIGYITLSQPGNGYTIVYIGHEECFYPLDPFSYTNGGSIWDTAPIFESDLNTLCAKLMVTFPYGPNNAPMTSYTVENAERS